MFAEYDAMALLPCVFIAVAVSVALSVLFLPRVIGFARNHDLFDITQDNRRMHSSDIPRLGGVLFFPLTLVAVLVTMWLAADDVPLAIWREAIGFAVALSILYVIGLCDDIKGLGFVVKLVGQILAGLCLCLSGLVLNGIDLQGNYIHLPESYGWLATVFAVVLVTNAFNFIDGIDALAATLGVVSATTITAFSVVEGHSVLAIGAATLVGALAGFLVFNLAHGHWAFRKVFMGDCGSLTLGGMITVMVIAFLRAPHMSIAEPWVLTPLLLPVLDAVWVIGYRLAHFSSPFRPDKHHIHHHLVAVCGSQLKTTAIIVALDLVLVTASVFVSLSEIRHATLIFVLSAMSLWVLLHIFLIHNQQKNKTK